MATIVQTKGRYSEQDDINDIFTITDENGIAAELYIHPETRLIMNIETRADRQGEGLARALYEHADKVLGGIYHIPAWGCTPEGLAFAEAMGGDVMDDETAARVVGFDLDVLNNH